VPASVIGPVRIFSARACAAPLEKAAAIFQKQTGIEVQISVCARHCAKPVAEEAVGEAGSHDFLQEIAEYAVHDLAISGAEYLLDDGEVRGIVAKGQRTTIAYRVSAIVVPKGNPAGVQGLKDLARPGVRIGVSVIDCLKGLWEDVSARAGLLGPIRRNITFHANGCVAIVEAVAQGVVDAAFGWTAFGHMADGRIEIIPLPRREQILRGTCIGLLSFARNPAAARQFMEFLTTPAAQGCYKEFGWVIQK